MFWNSGSDLSRILGASWLEWLALIVAIAVGLWMIVRVRAWFREDEDPAAHDREMLLQIGDLHRQGDLSEAEYRSIKSQLARRENGPLDREKRNG